MYFAIFFISLFIALAGVIIFKVARGYTKTVEELHRPIDDLLKRGYRNGFLVIKHPKSGDFIQFSKYITGKGSNGHGIAFDFPFASWSAQYFDKIKRICELDDLDFQIEHTGSEISFLSVDFKNNSISAYEFSKQILFDVMGVEKDQRLKVRLENASVE